MNGETVNFYGDRKRIIQHWLVNWNNETRGRWISKLLPDITSWIGRKFVKVNSYLIQLLCGHDYFCKCSSIDEAEHTSFHGKRWRLERRNLQAKVDACTIENFCDVILSSEKNWNSKASYTGAFVKSKKFDLDERIRIDV